jgi:hypothetical protein
MTLWHIIRFTTIRHLWLVTITGSPANKQSLWSERWVAVKQRKAVAWDPNLLHQFLTGGDVQQDEP